MAVILLTYWLNLVICRSKANSITAIAIKMSDKLKDVVKEHRKQSGLTQAQLAKLAGVGKTVVYDIEHGKESVHSDTLTKILRVLNGTFVLRSPLVSVKGNQPSYAYEKSSSFSEEP